ncbi:RidA family protein [Blastococcus sp. SYSU D00695]
MTDAPSISVDSDAHPWGAGAPFAQSVTTNAPLVFLSGQFAIDDSGQLAHAGDFEGQARLAFRNLERAVTSAGATLGGVVSMTVYLKDAGDFDTMRTVRAEFLDPPFPAVTAVQATLMHPDLLIEIAAVAAIGVDRTAG